MNASIEFHDSVVGELIADGDDAKVAFVPAYVHRSDGEPGVDPGTGWSQNAVLVLRRAVIHGAAPIAATAVWDGQLVVGGQHHDHLPCPFDTDEAVEIKLEFVTGQRVTLTGIGAAVQFLGEAQYVEEFKP